MDDPALDLLRRHGTTSQVRRRNTLRVTLGVAIALPGQLCFNIWCRAEPNFGRNCPKFNRISRNWPKPTLQFGRAPASQSEPNLAQRCFPCAWRFAALSGVLLKCVPDRIYWSMLRGRQTVNTKSGI